MKISSSLLQGTKPTWLPITQTSALSQPQTLRLTQERPVCCFSRLLQRRQKTSETSSPQSPENYLSNRLVQGTLESINGQVWFLGLKDQVRKPQEHAIVETLQLRVGKNVGSKRLVSTQSQQCCDGFVPIFQRFQPTSGADMHCV